MNRPRVSIGRLMVVVAILALDCGLVRLFANLDQSWRGLLAAGLLVSASLTGVVIFRDSARRFAFGFMVTALISSVCVLETDAEKWNHNVTVFVDGLILLLPVSLVARVDCLTVRPTAPGQVILEAALWLPFLALSLAGGLVGLLFRRRVCLNPASDPIPT